MSSSYQPDYDRSLSPDSDLEVLDWPNISRPSGGRRRASCIEGVGLPASKRTQNLVLYRSKDTQGKRLQQRQRSISYHVGAQFDKDETLEERPRNRSLSPAFSAPNLGQLNHLPLKCTPLVQRAVLYCKSSCRQSYNIDLRNVEQIQKSTLDMSSNGLNTLAMVPTGAFSRSWYPSLCLIPWYSRQLWL
jgi:hypothetical protein